jgi:hypothetical protein
VEWLHESSELRTVIGNLPIGLWIASLLGAWCFAAWGLVASLRGGRRLILALRWSTVSCIIEFMGLAAMVLMDNPERWKPLAWMISLTPLGLAVLAVMIASLRGNELARPSLEAGDGR